MHWVSSAGLILLVVQIASAHNALLTPMRMAGEATQGPLSDGQFPCSVGASKMGAAIAAAPDGGSYDAGGTIPVKFSSQTWHGGGSSQMSLSYDQGKTWKVIQSFQGDMPRESGATVQLPKNIPSSKALFAWSWIPVLSGQPEFYMSCSVITINKGTGSMSDLDQFPDMFVATIPSVNTCKLDASPGSVKMVYPNPGNNVVTIDAYKNYKVGQGLVASTCTKEMQPYQKSTQPDTTNPTSPDPVVVAAAPDSNVSTTTTSSTTSTTSGTTTNYYDTVTLNIDTTPDSSSPAVNINSSNSPTGTALNNSSTTTSKTRTCKRLHQRRSYNDYAK